jgi:hypothetical protein
VVKKTAMPKKSVPVKKDKVPDKKEIVPPKEDNTVILEAKKGTDVKVTYK